MSTNSTEPCPLCDLKDQDVESTDYGKRKHLTCRRCGELRITDLAATQAKNGGLQAKLSAWARSRTDRQIECLELSRDTLQDIIDGLREYSVLDKQALLLAWLGARSTFPGEIIAMEPALDFPVCWCSNESELNFHLDALTARGLTSAAPSPYLEETSLKVALTPAGWTHLDDRNRPRAISDQAFIAMSFDSTLLDAWQFGIQHGVAKTGYKPFRTDAQPSIDRIDVQIMSEIKRSHILIADVTLQRPGVYFEAGYAIGLGIPVFWCVREDDASNVHFDTRQYNHIVWKSPQDLAKKLHDFIIAIAGPPTAP